MVHYFNQGGVFMWPILILLIIGIMISIERFISLTRASVNTRKFLAKVKEALARWCRRSAGRLFQHTRSCCLYFSRWSASFQTWC